MDAILVSVYPMSHGPVLDFCALDVSRQTYLEINMLIDKNLLSKVPASYLYRRCAQQFKSAITQESREKKYIVNAN